MNLRVGIGSRASLFLSFFLYKTYSNGLPNISMNCLFDQLIDFINRIDQLILNLLINATCFKLVDNKLFQPTNLSNIRWFDHVSIF